MSTNENQHEAKRAKNDEFYTQLTDIEKEFRHYWDHFRGRTILCNCSDSRSSNFFKYFSLQFEHLKLKKLVAISYKNTDPDANYGDSAQAITVTYEGEQHDNRKPDSEETVVMLLDGDGDFRSQECIEYLKEADVVITNPPFSLFREYIAQLMEYDKKFLIIGSVGAIAYKEVFKHIKCGGIWLGHNTVRLFGQPDGTTGEGARSFWYTNLDTSKRHEDLLLYRTYYGNEDKYPKYDNYDAIEVSRTESIPEDYYGAMGVPVTFLDKHNPEQFEIVGLLADKRAISDALLQGVPTYLDEQHKRYVGAIVNGKATYSRIIIRRVDQSGSHGGDHI